jgi:hypothetical protein
MEQRAPQATPLPIESIAMRQYQSVGITFGRMGIMCAHSSLSGFWGGATGNCGRPVGRPYAIGISCAPNSAHRDAPLPICEYP